MAEILFELEENQALQLLSLRNNVLRIHKEEDENKLLQNPSKKEQTLKLKKLKWDIVNSLTKIAKGPYFLHMDISGLLLGSEALKHIVFEGVRHSKTMLGFHFLWNRVDHWTRM